MGAVRDTIYNNYLSMYAPKELTRYDSHKKSELRSVYNSIVKLNKESPWYLPTTSKDTQQYAVALKENARSLHNTIAQLGGLEENGLFKKKSAYSSDESVITASFIGELAEDEAAPEFQIEVEALASPQENMGLFLPDEEVSMWPDTYSFDIAINDMNYEFQFAISEEETNKEVQTRLARLINNASIGIKASVLEEDGRSSLRLITESSGLPEGKDSLFTITDNKTSKSSGTVAYFGLDYTTKEASNAYFLINGEERESHSNHFTVGKMFEVELKGVSKEGEAATVGLKPDVESLTDNISHLIGSYNDFLRTAADFLDSQRRSRYLVNEMKSIASYYNEGMESIGVTMGEDGSLKIDAGLLKEAVVQSADVNETFGHLMDFSNSLLRKSNQVSLNPMNYVEKTVVAYKNPGKSYVSPYTMSAYSGMMFNGYC